MYYDYQLFFLSNFRTNTTLTEVEILTDEKKKNHC